MTRCQDVNRILFVMDSFPGPHGGSERQAWLLAVELVKRGWTVGFLLLNDSLFLAREMPQAPRFVVGTRRLASLAFWACVSREVRRARASGFKVAHIWFNDCALALPIPLSLAGFRVIVARRDLGFWYTPTNRVLLRANARWIDVVVCNAEAVARSVSITERILPTKIRVVHNGVLPQATSTTRQEARARLGWPCDEFIACIVANLRPLKRMEDVIKAVGMFKVQTPGVRLAIVGDTQLPQAVEYYRALRQLVAECRLRDQVQFLGPLADASAVIVAADVCLLCSETEGLSNSLLEYQLLGRPVICTDVGGNPEIVEDGVGGLLVPARQPERIAEALSRLASDRAMREQMGRAGQISVMHRFGIDRMVDEYEAIYRGFPQRMHTTSHVVTT